MKLRLRLSELALGLLIAWGVALPAGAAERLNLRLGPFAQTVTLTDLEQFASTGNISPTLQLFAPILTPQVRQALNNRLQLDPTVAEQVIGDLFKSEAGRRAVDSLQSALPGLTVEQLQAGLYLAMRQANGLNILSVLRAIPQETVTVDLTQAIALVTQFNLPYLQTQAISPVLERELAVDAPPLRTNFDPAAPGDRGVQRRSMVLQDTQRQRTLPVDLYWSGESRGPLVVISPGLEANRSFLAYLADHLASHGFVVAAIEHPGGAYQRSTLPTRLEDVLPAREFVERPGDVRFLLDELAKLNGQPGELQGKLNTEQVSIIGHSLGGYTALALGGAEVDLEHLRRFCQRQNPIQYAPADWLQCAAVNLPGDGLNLRDRRIAQAIVLNPVVGELFGNGGLKQVAVPTLVLASTEDSLTPVLRHQLQPFDQLPQPKYLVTAIGGTHLSVGDPAYLTGITAQNSPIRERRGEEVEPLRQLLRGVSLAFIEQLTPEAARYQPFLSPAYAQSFSRQGIVLRLNASLPPSLAPWLGAAAIF